MYDFIGSCSYFFNISYPKKHSGKQRIKRFRKVLLNKEILWILSFILVNTGYREAKVGQSVASDQANQPIKIIDQSANQD